MRSVWAVAAGGLAATLSLVSCTGSSGGTSSQASRSPHKFVDGKTFVAATNSDLGNLDPSVSNAFTGVWVHPTALAYDSLISVDAEGEPSSLLAEKWQNTTTTAQFTLRKGITCSDGSPLVASDVAANLNYVAAPANKSVLAGQFVKLGSTATADDATGTIQFTSGAADPFLLQDVGSLPIVCKKGMENRKLLAQGTLGTGLYKLTAIVPGSQYTLVRRKDYAWGPGEWKNNQPGLPDKIIVRVVANPTTTANLLLAGDVNYAVALSQRDAPRLSSLFKVEQLLPTGVFLFNEAPGHPTADPVVRKAFVQALNLPEVGKVIGDGAGKPSRQINEYFVPNVCPGDTVGDRIPTVDVAAAKSALDQDGWVPGADGIRLKDGKRLSVSMPVYSGFQPFTTAAELMTKQLKDVGIALVARGAAGPAFGQAQATGSFDVIVQSWSFPNPSQMVASYTGKPLTAGGNNLGDVHNERYNQIVAEAATKVGKEGCPQWNEAESELINALDVIPFWSTPSIQYGHKAIFSIAQFTWSIRMTED